jgi:hypothetical protein
MHSKHADRRYAAGTGPRSFKNTQQKRNGDISRNNTCLSQSPHREVSSNGTNPRGTSILGEVVEVKPGWSIINTDDGLYVEYAQDASILDGYFEMDDGMTTMRSRSNVEEDFIRKYLGSDILYCDGKSDDTDGDPNINENGHPTYDKREPWTAAPGEEIHDRPSSTGSKCRKVSSEVIFM